MVGGRQNGQEGNGCKRAKGGKFFRHPLPSLNTELVSANGITDSEWQTMESTPLPSGPPPAAITQNRHQRRSADVSDGQSASVINGNAEEVVSPLHAWSSHSENLGTTW